MTFASVLSAVTSAQDIGTTTPSTSMATMARRIQRSAGLVRMRLPRDAACQANVEQPEQQVDGKDDDRDHRGRRQVSRAEGAGENLQAPSAGRAERSAPGQHQNERDQGQVEDAERERGATER